MLAKPDHPPKEVLGLAMLWFYGQLGWYSLLQLIVKASTERSSALLAVKHLGILKSSPAFICTSP